MNADIWKRIKYWRRKYKDKPNGYFVAMMIGEEYTNEKSRKSKARRIK
tara:strand:- start:1039 stop:1182 length:144 start_codon:yes stop_codon:yes gene_type:complete